MRPACTFPPPGARFSEVCTRSYLLLLQFGRVHPENFGHTVLGGVHAVGAQNKTLISVGQILGLITKHRDLFGMISHNGCPLQWVIFRGMGI